MNLVTVVEEHNISVIDVLVLQLSLLRKTPYLIPEIEYQCDGKEGDGKRGGGARGIFRLVA